MLWTLLYCSLMVCLLETGSVGEGSYATRVASLQSGLQQAERENERDCEKGGISVKMIQQNNDHNLLNHELCDWN